MSIAIAIDTETATAKDWEALAAFTAVMRGLLTADGPVTIAGAAPALSASVGTLARIEAAARAEAAPPPPLASEALIASAAAAVTAPPPPPPAAGPNGVELDKDGLPWDVRIHAGGKTKNADGSWRAKRGVDEATVASVVAELRHIMAAPVVVVPPAVDPAAAFGSPVVAPPLAIVADGSIADATVAPPPPPGVAVTVPPAVVADAPVANEFAEIMKLVTGRQAAGTLTTAMVTTIAQQLGLTGVVDLAKRPDLIPAFRAMLP